MKTHLTKAILILFMVVATVPSLAQQRGTVSFGYDANGNRIVQQIEVTGDRRHAENETCMSLYENNVQLAAISLYPNPTKGTVNVLIDRNAVGKPVQMTVTTVSGSVVIEKPITVPLETIDLSNQAAGTYIVKLTIDGETYIGKITKE